MKIDRIAFFGTPEFAVPTLRSLCEVELAPVVVVSQPSRASGRGRRVRLPAVARFAQERGLEVWQPGSIRGTAFRERFGELDLDIAVVAAYGRIFPGPLLRSPRLGCVNLHASLLPSYRGAAPIQAALAAGEVTTGVTTMQMEEGLDSGPILLQEELVIGDRETTPELSVRLAEVGGRLVVHTLRRLEEGSVVPRPQDEAGASLAPRLDKEDGVVDWTLSATTISNRLRAFTPWPGQTALLGGLPVKLVEVTPLLTRSDQEPAPGTLFGLRGEMLAVACGGGSTLGIARLQRPGRRALAARDFVNGERLRSGDRFDSPSAS